MKISLIHPSRGRARKSFENSSEWIRKAGNVEVELIVAVDLGDPQEREYIKLYAGSCHVFQSKSVVEATNAAAKLATGDILIYLSDDFKCPDNWAELVVKEFEGENRPLLLKVDDMLQPFSVPVLTIPMMNRNLYERLGYFWHPLYKSMHVDVDLYYTVFNIGALKNAPHLKFEHCHVSVGKAQDDETYRASSANWNQGLEVYNRRKKMKFPV
jgi:glycosyltransferase involved in cell wall biosynthesis